MWAQSVFSSLADGYDGAGFSAAAAQMLQTPFVGSGEMNDPMQSGEQDYNTESHVDSSSALPNPYDGVRQQEAAPAAAAAAAVAPVGAIGARLEMQLQQMRAAAAAVQEMRVPQQMSMQTSMSVPTGCSSYDGSSGDDETYSNAGAPSAMQQMMMSGAFAGMNMSQSGLINTPGLAALLQLKQPLMRKWPFWRPKTEEEVKAKKEKRYAS
jgi:hypothetical protein